VPGGQPGGEGTGAGGGALDDDDEPPPPPKVSRNVPINLPEDAEPPEPDEGNEQPECPEGVRSTGVAMTVVLKIVINEKGYVDKIDVMKGDAALIQPVISAVRKWHYSPAMLDGKPLTVYKIVKVTCKP
jgi:TonB family protein